MLPTNFRFIWPNSFRGDESKKSANQKQESTVVAMFVTDRDGMSNLYRGPSIDASYQVSDHLTKRFQRKRFFRNRPIRNKSRLWWPCLLTDRDEMSNFYRGPSIDAYYQVSVHLARRFQRRFKKICIEISIFKQELSFFLQKIF
jgi:hypothetical protein